MKSQSVSFSVKEVANILKGTVSGDAGLLISGLCPLHQPVVGHLTFIKGRSQTAAWRTLIKLPEVAVLVEPNMLPEQEALRSLRCTLIIVPSAQLAFLESTNYFYAPEEKDTSIHPTAIIDSTASISDGVSIGAFCVVGPRVQVASGVQLHNSVTLYRDVTIGARSELHTGVVVREGCSIGSDCIIHNNSVIGADGFGYIPDPASGIKKIPHVGVVNIGDHVEIGALTSIDRATIGVTTVGAHTKIDNHVQIGHNVIIGKHCLICAQAGIAGSAVLGDGVVLGGGTGVADHVHICSRVRTGGHSGVTTNIDEPGDYLGMPAIKASIYRRQQVSWKRLTSRDKGSKEG